MTVNGRDQFKVSTTVPGTARSSPSGPVPSWCASPSVVQISALQRV
ncbi:hypothetical protein [Polymorphospora sp. NPDC050346]